MTLREMGAADNLPWHLEHMGLHGPNMKTKEYDKFQSPSVFLNQRPKLTQRKEKLF